MHSTLDIQRRLKQLGFDPGKLDGIPGPRTDAAIVAFKKSKGLRARPFIGPVTMSLLFGPTKPMYSADRTDPPWMKIARSLNGLREIKGKRHHPKIIQMWQAIGAPFRDDETPWCASFVGYCLEEVGFRSTRSAAARSYTKWRDGVKLRDAVGGAIVVYWRGKRNGWSGHVGFVDSVDRSGRINTLGGNQGNAVNVKPFGRDRLLGFYWPRGYPLDETLAIRDTGKASSTNEA